VTRKAASEPTSRARRIEKRVAQMSIGAEALAQMSLGAKALAQVSIGAEALAQPPSEPRPWPGVHRSRGPGPGVHRSRGPGPGVHRSRGRTAGRKRWGNVIQPLDGRDALALMRCPLWTLGLEAAMFFRFVARAVTASPFFSQ
jgi:hypothetical protein